MLGVLPESKLGFGAWLCVKNWGILHQPWECAGCLGTGGGEGAKDPLVFVLQPSPGISPGRRQEELWAKRERLFSQRSMDGASW